MKRKLLICGLVATLSIVFFACQKEMRQKEENTEVLGTMARTSLTATECGTPLVKELANMYDTGTWGTIEVTNDNENIIIRINSTLVDMYLGKATLSFGSEQDVIDDLTAHWSWTPCDGPVQYDRRKTWTPLTVASDTIMIPASYFQEDGCIWLSVNVELNGIYGTLGCAYGAPYDNHIGSGQWQSAFKYCRQECPPQTCDRLRTQTPGGWGAPPQGNNPGAYLHANFAQAFPNGLSVGCYPGNYYLHLTSAQAITDLLPTGGKAAALTANYTDPASLKNVLAGHLVALTLSAGFDAWDEDFGLGGFELGDMIITEGPFSGSSVSAFLAEANMVFGSCGGSHSISEILQTADKINNNYTDGKADNGYLVCPDPTER